MALPNNNKMSLSKLIRDFCLIEPTLSKMTCFGITTLRAIELIYAR